MTNLKKNTNRHKNETLSLETEKILGAKITITPEDSLLKIIQNRLKNNIKTSIVTPNPEIVLSSLSDSKLKNIINNSDISIPDGTGIVWAIRYKYKKIIKVVRGREFTFKLLDLCQKEKIPVLVLTGSSIVANITAKKIRTNYPDLEAEIFLGPNLNLDGETVSEVDRLIQIDIENYIKKYKKIAVFSGFGATKQEKWLKNISSNLPGVLLTIGVGGTFDYYSNLRSLPPKKIAYMGLEWLWRLIQEPNRLPRIINALLIFPLKVYLSK